LKTLTFRLAGGDDLAAVHQLIESAFRGDSARRGWTHEADLLGGQRTDVESLAEIVASEGQSMILADRDGAIAGCMVLNDKGDSTGERVAYLGMLTVSPLLQGAGIGGALVREAERYARETLGARSLEMRVIKQRGELIAWYERRGYALTGDEAPFPLDDPRFGLPKTRDLTFVIMSKRLD
jgi:ribosomal protein S18 acetylase RimI-like enzyme